MPAWWSITQENVCGSRGLECGTGCGGRSITSNRVENVILDSGKGLRKENDCDINNKSVRINTYLFSWDKSNLGDNKENGKSGRKQLAYEMTHKGFNIGYVHPHYYFRPKVFIQFSFIPKEASMR